MNRGPLAAGAVAGYVASRTMDVATTVFSHAQSDESKRREQELAPGGMLVRLGRQLGQVAGRDLDDVAAGKVGAAVHRAFGVGYGVLAAALTRRGMHPLAAGLTVGAAAFLVVDEGTALSQLTAYPPVSHLRGVVGHGTLGLALGALLRLLGRA